MRKQLWQMQYNTKIGRYGKVLSDCIVGDDMRVYTLSGDYSYGLTRTRGIKVIEVMKMVPDLPSAIWLWEMAQLDAVIGN